MGNRQIKGEAESFLIGDISTMLTDHTKVDVSKARIYYRNGLVDHYDNQKLACSTYFNLPKGIRCCFRGVGDKTPVYSHSYVDRL